MLDRFAESTKVKAIISMIKIATTKISMLRREKRTCLDIFISKALRTFICYCSIKKPISVVVTKIQADFIP